ncbi:DUF58 domain-containing protein [Anaerocolumna sp. AGMB13025]|uniref:DUF58 domain-containing protein n=1 Tax=Anaerocolumna sp. AGMB13025 TaxID=3039116 RepID=UPI00241FD031|nr:DUF58 domain-containing protein [Anaerocolumna sp. AGMB13025]WFR56634.1 DUF58 domain-containing protein [Anaerocolumna sp. AGMB13025]
MLRNKLGYLLFLIFAGLFAVLYNEYFIGIIFLTAVLLPFVLLGIVIYSSYKIIIKLDSTTMVVGKEEFLNLTIHLKNTSVFPVSRMHLFIQYYNTFSGEVKKENIQVAVDQKSTQNVSCQITSKYCGNMQFEVKSVKLYDYFLIWSVNKKTRQSIQVAVMPETYEIPGDIIIENNTILADSDTYSEYKPGDDPSEVFGVREYREGDKPNRIHWKLSYKQNQLMIKEFSDPIQDAVLVLMEFTCKETQKSRLSIVDGLLDLAISVSYHLLVNEHVHKVSWYDKNYNAVRQFGIHNQTDCLAAMEEILKNQFTTDSRVILSEQSESFPKEIYTHVIYITSILNEEEIYGWVQNHKGTFFYLIYVNDMELNPVSETMKVLIQELKIILFEIDTKNIKESIAAVGNLWLERG